MVSEADTREEKINPKLSDCGWKTGGDVIVRREYPISIGKIIGKGKRESSLSADYVLIYKNVRLGIVEAKKSTKSYTEGIAQAKDYAERLKVRFTYATNGLKIYQIDMDTGEEKEVDKYPPPDELWNMTFKQDNNVFNRLMAIPTNKSLDLRYYQENAVNAFVKALSQNKKRILLTLATGTGKTRIAFQIAWKLMQARWTTDHIGERQPRILFLADRNILADQAFNTFSAFPDQKCLARIKPDEVRKNGRVPDAQSIFFTIFQTFMCGDGEQANFGQYPKDFFDLVIIDECHRGGANKESEWRAILKHFDSAVHLGLTATPKRKDNVDTYDYFGEPVYEYSLKQGISDGYLTPFRVRDVPDNFGTYVYNPSDDIDGEIDEEKTYTAADMNRKIQIEERERKRVQFFMNEINQNDKTIVFCATQEHAGVVRDIINQAKTVTQNPNYCVRVTANDGAEGETFLRQFQDTEKTIPTILTTSEKLSTGVDAVQIKNIVLLRPVNSLIEFKQIIGRGTRLCDDKAYFTIYDFENAAHNFEDPEWDGPIEYTGKERKRTSFGNNERADNNETDENDGGNNEETTQKITKITLGGGRTVEIIDNGTSFYDPETGKAITARQFIEKLVGVIPSFYKNEKELRSIWSNPDTRQELLSKLENSGYTLEKLNDIKGILNTPDTDVFDVLEYVSSYTDTMMTRQERAEQCKKLLALDKPEARRRVFIEFIGFVLSQYIQNGVKELNSDRISNLIKLKYGTPTDAEKELGTLDNLRRDFCDFQKYLYAETG